MSVPSPADSADLRRLLRKHLLSAAVSLITIVAIAVVLAVQFRTELDAFTVHVFETVGIGGLAGLLLFTDAFVSPIPPDSILILIASSPYHVHWPWLLPVLGIVSSLAGNIGYWCGRGLSNRPWAQRWFENLHPNSEEMVGKYGPWAVAIGALTPVPFSITCWTAGLMKLEYRSFFLPCLLRIPRYVAYYAAIAYFPRLFV